MSYFKNNWLVSLSSPFSGLGRWGPGRPEEQQRTKYRIHIACVLTRHTRCAGKCVPKMCLQRGTPPHQTPGLNDFKWLLTVFLIYWNTSGPKAQNVAKNALTSDCDWIITAFVTAHGSWTVSALRQAVQRRQCRHFLTSVVKKKTQGYPLIPLELLNKGLLVALDKFWKRAGTPTPPHQQPSFFWRLLNAQGVDVYASGHDVSVYPFHWSKGTLTAVLCSQPEQCEQPTVSLFIDLFGWKNASSSESVTSGETTEI